MQNIDCSVINIPRCSRLGGFKSCLPSVGRVRAPDCRDECSCSYGCRSIPPPGNSVNNYLPPLFLLYFFLPFDRMYTSAASPPPHPNLSQGITEIGRAAMVVDGKTVPQDVLEAEQMASDHAVPHVNFYDPAVYAVRVCFAYRLRTRERWASYPISKKKDENKNSFIRATF